MDDITADVYFLNNNTNIISKDPSNVIIYTLYQSYWAYIFHFL